MSKILLVEDNPQYQDVAQRYLASRGNVITLAKDYSEAIDKLKNPDFNGVITDCFFPELTGSGNRDLGYEAIKRMLDSDSRGRKETPTARAITKVGNLLGTEAVKHIVKNAHAEYRQEVDLYWALEQAIKEDETKQPLGILIAERSEGLGLPFILATSTYHHDELTQPVQDYVSRKGWKLVDCGPNSENEKETPQFWERAFGELERKL